MEITRFRRLLARVECDLLPAQHIELREHLDRIESGRVAELALGARSKAMAVAGACPHCGSAGATKHGRDRLERQRFRCRPLDAGGCGRTFNALTGTPFARMRKPDRWHDFAKALSEGFISVDRLHARGLGVSRLTAWRWRNRFMEAQAQRQADHLSGVVEADETYFKNSFKGSRGWVRKKPPANRPPRYRGEPAIKRGLSSEHVAVLTAIDSSDNTIEAKISGLSEVHTILDGRIAPGSVVCADGARTYQWVALNAGCDYRRIWTPKQKTKAQKLKGGKPRRKGNLALGRVNAQHSRMKSFVNHQARGASTANLPTYLGWARALRRPDFCPEALLRDALAAPPTPK